jgi:predicted RNase H-like nuclease (RuvC/YqgF family)
VTKNELIKEIEGLKKRRDQDAWVLQSMHRYITALEENLAYHRKTVAELRNELGRYKRKEGT